MLIIIMYHNFINITPTVLFKLQWFILQQMAPHFPGNTFPGNLHHYNWVTATEDRGVKTCGREMVTCDLCSCGAHYPTRFAASG